MSRHDPTDPVEDLIRLMAAHRGGHHVPEWVWLAGQDHEFMAALTTLSQAAFSFGVSDVDTSGRLSGKLKELVAVAILAGQRDAERLAVHLRRAIGLGATDQEVLDVLQPAMVVTGAPALRLGIEQLLRLRNEAREPTSTTHPTGKVTVTHPAATPITDRVVDDVQVVECHYHNEGIRLAATLYRPPGATPTSPMPGLLLLPGYIGTQRIALPVAARHFAAKGYVVLTIDSRGFGKSEGPRWRLICTERVRDAQMAATFLLGHPEVAAQPIGVYGSSFGGSIAVALAAVDPRVGAIVTVGSPVDGESWLRSMRSYSAWLRLLARIEADVKRRCLGEASENIDYLEAAPNDDPDGADFVSRNHMADPDYHGTLTLESLQRTIEFKPVLDANKISPRPILVIHGEDDPRVPLEHAINLYHQAGEPKALRIMPRTTHFDVTNPGPRFHETLALADDWFERHIKPPVEPYSPTRYL